MAWEESSRICLHMQLIAILSRIGVRIEYDKNNKNNKNGCDIISDSNPNIPVSSIMHTFLIDRVGNVLIVGSPLKSEKIRNLMFQMLDGKE